MITTPICWMGGKGRIVKKILPYIPKSAIYIEPFGGGASVLLAKDKYGIEVYNDKNPYLYNLFCVLSNKISAQKLQLMLELTPYSRVEYIKCLSEYKNCDDSIESARMFFVVARQSFGGRFGAGWGFNSNVHGAPHGHDTVSYSNAVNNIDILSDRLSGVVVHNDDWRYILNKYDSDDSVFYVDPPYVHQTRSISRYDYELTDDDHIELVDTLLQIRGMALVSGYDNKIYSKLEKYGWDKITWKTSCNMAGRTRGSELQGVGSVNKNQSRVECLWRSHNVKGQISFNI